MTPNLITRNVFLFEFTTFHWENFIFRDASQIPFKRHLQLFVWTYVLFLISVRARRTLTCGGTQRMDSRTPENLTSPTPTFSSSLVQTSEQYDTAPSVQYWPLTDDTHQTAVNTSNNISRNSMTTQNPHQSKQQQQQCPQPRHKWQQWTELCKTLPALIHHNPVERKSSHLHGSRHLNANPEQSNAEGKSSATPREQKMNTFHAIWTAFLQTCSCRRIDIFSLRGESFYNAKKAIRLKCHCCVISRHM